MIEAVGEDYERNPHTLGKTEEGGGRHSWDWRILMHFRCASAAHAWRFCGGILIVMHHPVIGVDQASLSVPAKEVSDVGNVYVASLKNHRTTVGLEVLQALALLAAMHGDKQKCSVFAALLQC
ncbi:hypothetical protein [Aphanothece minutissima]|uniref:hypothetical protein n=1 Tax=Aphanothece minutissima TaxID=543815 RepID=UPI0011B2915F|nr:hypothetical protein [Aphanothece minutissima]